MRKLKLAFIVFFLASTAFFSSCCNKDSSSKAPVDYVDPMIGTDFFGHTFPGATLPRSMVQLSPDSGVKGWTYSSGYAYKDNSIIGFSHTHLSGVGYTACGDVLLMPTITDQILVTPGDKSDPDKGYRSRFSHQNESATPGYYSVLLDDYNIKAELTVTQRVGLHRYTFPAADKAPIVLDLGHTIGGTWDDDISHLQILNDSTVVGTKSSQGVKVFFVARFNKPFNYYGTFDAGYFTPESGASIFPYKNEEKGRKIGAFLVYRTEESEQVLVKVGISFTSIEGAKRNLDTELDHWDFDRVKAEARSVWNEEISRITVEDPSEEKKQIFYTSMYHSILPQQISNDVDGNYMGMDGEVHAITEGDFYPSFSCWDTYRTQHPLQTIYYPDHIDNMIRSIDLKAKEYGWLPAQHFRNEFGQGMVGDHLVPIITDAYMKGYRDYDIESLYEAMKTKALTLPPTSSEGRSGLDLIMDLGYAPCDEVTESVPNTLELSYNDWCIAQLAKELGKEDDYGLFMARSRNYENLYDAESGFFRPKKANGEWLPHIGSNEQEIISNGEHSYYRYFDPLLVGRRPNRHFTESNAWQYLWSVQHDPAGLIQLMGGNEAFNQRLDEFFEMPVTISPPKYVGVVGTLGQYVHGNQPSHHVAYLYNFAGKPWKTQKKVRQVMDQLYRTGPGGLCGNEDMGSLSSWYMLSAMGIYPVAPGSTSYSIGSPLMEKVDIKLPEGKQFTIQANNNSDENIYIQSCSLNGKVVKNALLDHSEIMAGGKLVFEMGPEPNKDWGITAD